ncbi:hypothetical protein [Oricola indica]|uniref:hypothetical protein n=1 Tax=Oricola indica TaxID=2872591 RepID=UPI003CCBA996
MAETGAATIRNFRTDADIDTVDTIDRHADALLLHEPVVFEHDDSADGFDTYDERVVHMRLTLH